MKRRALKLAGLLLLGAALNVAVAWGCARWQIGENRVSHAGISSTDDVWLKSIGFDSAGYEIMSVAEADQLNLEREQEHQREMSVPAEREVTATTLPDGSLVLEIHGSKKQWDGNIVYNDHTWGFST